MKAFDTLHLPSEHDTELAKAALETLADTQNDLTLTVADKTLTLPSSVLELLKRSLEHLAAGRAVGIVSYGTFISVHDTAQLLNVSTEYVKKLLEAGELPFETKGMGRMIPLKDVLEYKRVSYAKREAALTELTQLSQELGLYDVLPLHLQSEKTK
jgi:excisionase family DNA binding protein